ncbi:MAG TPA: hypothetical protein VD833_17670 [Vicinamibacterales bacterium]|nr:hypothetical protein [Vicinamibacterales bacterium]
MTISRSDEAGFSLIELLVATLLLVTVGMLVFEVASQGLRIARARPEASDLHQRLRVAVEMIRSDLLAAGAGLPHGDHAGPLVQWFAPLVPARTGAIRADPDLTAFTDRLSLFYVPEGGWVTRLAADALDPGGPLLVDTGTACPPAGLCGFTEGSRAAVIDRAAIAAGSDFFTVTGIAGGLSHGPSNPPFSRPYAAATSVVVPMVQRVYYLDRGQSRLMLYDGHVTDVPLVDNVTDLAFAYYATPSPYDVPRPSEGDDSCLFAGSPPVPLLPDLGIGSVRLLGLTELQDGPVCGSGTGRFDADLLRIRQVRVTLRLDVAAADLRTRSAAFRRAGTSPGAESVVADYEVTFDVSPRNLSPVR